MRTLTFFLVIAGLLLSNRIAAADWMAQAQHRTVELRNFTFHTGQTLPSLSMSVYTLGTPRRDEQGRINNALMLLRGTAGSGRSMLRPDFGDELFGPGQALDIDRYYVIAPDNLGHGRSAKPSDGMRTRFPRYDYEDMVLAQHRLLTEALDVHQLEMILGTSMGCMHSFVWAINHPGFVDRFVALACNAIEIAGLNRMTRKMVIDGFKDDPAYREGAYETPGDLHLGQRIFANTAMIVAANPYRLHAETPSGEASDQRLDALIERRQANPVDPNDTIYQFDASRNYNPAPRLAEIQAPFLWINSADDFINPPGLGEPESLAARMPNARFVLIPASAETRGHGTHSAPRFWKDEVIRFLAEGR